MKLASWDWDLKNTTCIALDHAIFLTWLITFKHAILTIICTEIWTIICTEIWTIIWTIICTIIWTINGTKRRGHTPRRRRASLKIRQLLLQTPVMITLWITSLLLSQKEIFQSIRTNVGQNQSQSQFFS